MKFLSANLFAVKIINSPCRSHVACFVSTVNRAFDFDIIKGRIVPAENVNCKICVLHVALHIHGVICGITKLQVKVGVVDGSISACGNIRGLVCVAISLNNLHICHNCGIVNS